MSWLTDRSDLLDAFFWRSKEGCQIFSPLLWLGKSFRTSDSLEIDLRRSIKSSFAYRWINALWLHIVLVILVTVILNFYYPIILDKGHMKADLRFLFFVVYFLVMAAMFFSTLLAHSRNLEPNKNRMTFEIYVENKIKNINKKKYFSSSHFIFVFCPIGILMSILGKEYVSYHYLIISCFFLIGWAYYRSLELKTFNLSLLKVENQHASEHPGPGSPSHQPSGSDQIRV